MTTTKRATISISLLSACLVAHALPSLAAGGSDDWPMFKGGAARAGIAGDGPDDGPGIRWRFEADAAFTGNVAVHGDLAYASSDDGSLHALDVQTGAERWRYEPQSLVSQPTIVDGSVLVFSRGNDLTSLDAASGVVEWTMPDVATGPTSPTVGDGSLYVGTADGYLVALDLTAHEERWRTQVSPASGAVHTPAFAEGRVYVSSDGGPFVAVEAANGSVAWSFDTGAFATGTAVVADGLAYIGAAGNDPDGRLWAIDALTGEERWSVDEVYHSPSVSEGVAYSGSATIGVAAHDTATGERLWTFPVQGPARPLAVAEGVVYVPADEEQRLYALDAVDGTELWRQDLDGGNDCCVAVANGAAFVGTWAGSLYAIGGSDDELTGEAGAALDPEEVVNPFMIVDELEPGTTGLSGAMSLAFGPDGNLYVAQTSPPSVVVLDPSGQPVRSYGSAGPGPGELDFGDRAPSIAVAPDGMVYVTEAGNSRVSVFDPEGSFVRHLGAFGDAPGRFLLPFEVVTDASGGVYVMDDMQRTVSKFDATGAFEWRLDPHADPDLLGYFHRGALDAVGNVWLTNDDNGLILAFDSSGSKVDRWSSREVEVGFEPFDAPCQVALGPGELAVIFDCFEHAMAVFDAEHRPVGAWVEDPSLPLRPALAFGPDGRLYGIADEDYVRAGADGEADSILVMEVDLPPAG